MYPIIIEAYNPEWSTAFEQEREKIAYALRDLRVQLEHIGSTSVPGLAAKPIIDILIVVENADDAVRAISPLVILQYDCRGEAGIAGRIFFGKGEPRTHHLHLYTSPHNPERERHLLFRDYLRAHRDAVQQYAVLKYGLAEKFRDDRDAYTEAKSDFIRGIVDRARVDRENGRL